MMRSVSGVLNGQDCRRLSRGRRAFLGPRWLVSGKSRRLPRAAKSSGIEDVCKNPLACEGGRSLIIQTTMSDNNFPETNRVVPKFLLIALACLPCVLLSTGCDEASGSSRTGPEEIGSLREQIASASADIEKIQTSFSQARAIEAWVSAAHPIQPLIVAITRSVLAPSRLKQLQLVREADSPGRVIISLELSDAPKSQMESILEAIHNLGFREQSVTRAESSGAIKFDAVLVWKDSDSEGMRLYPGGQTVDAVQSVDSSTLVSAAPPLPTSPNADEDGPSLRATLQSLQDYAHTLTYQTADTLEFAHMWKPYFALTNDANLAERGIAMKLREAELAVPFSSFKVEDCGPLYPGLSEAIPQILRSEVVIEDSFAKGINWLGIMERIRPTMRICRVSISPSAGKDECRFDLVLEVPLLKQSPK
jgi:hypothetical protein